MPRATGVSSAIASVGDTVRDIVHRFLQVAHALVIKEIIRQVRRILPTARAKFVTYIQRW